MSVPSLLCLSPRAVPAAGIGARVKVRLRKSAAVPLGAVLSHFAFCSQLVNAGSLRLGAGSSAWTRLSSWGVCCERCGNLRPAAYVIGQVRLRINQFVLAL